MAGWSGLEMPGCYVDMDAAEIEYTDGGNKNLVSNIMLVAGIVIIIQASGIVVPEGQSAVVKATATRVAIHAYAQAGVFIITGAAEGAQTGKIGLGNLCLYEKDA